jgi:hypothetical protein
MNKIKKTADQFSDSYYKDALEGLSEEFASSYYTGLRGMYDQRAENVKPDYSSLYVLHDETGADLVDQAHPDSVVLSDAMGNGGLVENVVERHRHMQGVANSTPSGNYRSKHAWTVNELVKLAGKASDDRNSEAVNLITKAIVDVIESK